LIDETSFLYVKKELKKYFKKISKSCWL